jgi:hypothetical protein
MFSNQVRILPTNVMPTLAKSVEILGRAARTETGDNGHPFAVSASWSDARA